VSGYKKLLTGAAVTDLPNKPVERAWGEMVLGLFDEDDGRYVSAPV
jgi:hypothetical protein